MRTQRTVFRIVREDGTEVYRGKRSAVLRKLSTLSRRGEIAGANVEVGTFKPEIEPGPVTWKFVRTAHAFLATR